MILSILIAGILAFLIIGCLILLIQALAGFAKKHTGSFVFFCMVIAGAVIYCLVGIGTEKIGGFFSSCRNSIHSFLSENVIFDSVCVFLLLLMIIKLISHLLFFSGFSREIKLLFSSVCVCYSIYELFSGIEGRELIHSMILTIEIVLMLFILILFWVNVNRRIGFIKDIDPQMISLLRHCKEKNYPEGKIDGWRMCWIRSVNWMQGSISEIYRKR